MRGARSIASGGEGLVITIDLGALASNYRRLAALSAPAECAAVVKADAYGVGIDQAVPALAAAGARTFFVALPDEGARVRAALAGTDAPGAVIYVLNGFFADGAETFRAASLRPVLSTFASVESWAAHGRGAPSGLQVDTGMNRLGLTLHEALELTRRGDLLAKAVPELLMSHLACADEPERAENLSQAVLFREIASQFPGLPASLANSAGIHLGKEFRFDMVRPGIALYGGGFARNRPPLATVVTAKARILQVRDIAAGEAIGYGGALRLREAKRVAILSAGYGDGYLRLAGSSDARSGASAVVRGRRATLLGRVSMDLMAVDVTEIRGTAEGDWAELFGPSMPIDEVAAAAGTIGYELLTGLSRRAARRYDGGSRPPPRESDI
jgi:alanine racemase